MNIEDIFDLEKFNDLELAKIYNTGNGMILIPDFIKPEMCKQFSAEIRQNRKILVRAKENYGQAQQRFFKHYFGFAEDGKNKSPEFPLVSEFSEAYDKLTRNLIDIAGLSQKRVSSTGIHVYWKSGKYGLSPHRDESSAQLISSFVIDGYSPVYTADDHGLQKNKMIYNPKAGSLLLMRGPRDEEERGLTKKGSNYDPQLDPRPIHCIGGVEEDRVVIILRHIDESLKQGRS
jgi:hypothetical protein